RFRLLRCTDNVTKYTCFETVFGIHWKENANCYSFSTVRRYGSRSARFAVKFYTRGRQLGSGWQQYANNSLSAIRNCSRTLFTHTEAESAAHLKDPDMFWDFISLRPETSHQVSFLFSDRGTPDGYRHMNGYGSHTFKLVNSAGEAVTANSISKTDQGIKNLSTDRADNLPPATPTTPSEICTTPSPKIMCNEGKPNRRPILSGRTLIPGAEPSPDKMLQDGSKNCTATRTRTAIATGHQLHATASQLSPNMARTVANYQRTRRSAWAKTQAGAPNLSPNSFSGPEETKQVSALGASLPNYLAKLPGNDSANEIIFSQVGDFWRKAAAQRSFRRGPLRTSPSADPEYGAAIQKYLDKNPANKL
uniref:Catalase domain-containing protein n=1 Tax=Macrostomum lignano TaxID=282301 RepID=A0A1I8FLR3_9PLAT